MGGWLRLSRDELIESIEDFLDESLGATTHHTTAKVVRMVNSLLETELAERYPLREERFQITGDGSTHEWRLPSPAFAVEAVFDPNEVGVHQMSYGDSLRLWVPFSVVAGPGALNYYIAPDNVIGFVPAPESGQVFRVHCRTAVPRLRETTETVTATDWTLADETVLGDFSACSEGDGVTAPDGRVYRILSIDGTTGCELSEPYRSASASGVDVEVGADLGIDSRWRLALAQRTAALLLLTELDDRAEAYLSFAERAMEAIAQRLRAMGGDATLIPGGRRTGRLAGL